MRKINRKMSDHKVMHLRTRNKALVHQKSMHSHRAVSMDDAYLYHEDFCDDFSESCNGEGYGIDAGDVEGCESSCIRDQDDAKNEISHGCGGNLPYSDDVVTFYLSRADAALLE